MSNNKVTKAEQTPLDAAKRMLMSVPVGGSINANLIRELGLDPQSICAMLTERHGYLFEVNSTTIKRLRSYGVMGKHNFTMLKPGESRVVDVPASAWPGVRLGMARSARATGWRFRSSVRSGAMVVTRVDGTDQERQAPLPFRTTQPGGSFKVAAGPSVNVSNIRVQANYHGRVMGCRFMVEADGEGGCTVTRLAPGEAAPAPAHRVPPKPAPRSFDEEEF